ncbi:MAG TPA: hypothetical protein VHY08_27690 [Bacillota bacterium]|nr:hypothetical protein [Bacillota bacterium]
MFSLILARYFNTGLIDILMPGKRYPTPGGHILLTMIEQELW